MSDDITFFSFMEQRVAWLRERGYGHANESDLWNTMQHPDYERSASRWPHVLAAIDDVRRHIKGGTENYRPRLLALAQREVYMAWRAALTSARRTEIERGRAERRAARLARRAKAAGAAVNDGAAIEAEKILTPFDPPA